MGYGEPVISEGPNRRAEDLGVTLHQGRHELIDELEPLAVLSGERGHGLGTLLLDCAEAVLDDLGARDVMIGVLAGNDAAQRFYERRGMTPAIIKLPRVRESAASVRENPPRPAG